MISKEIKKGYITGCNVALCSQFLPKLIKNIESTNVRQNTLTYDYKVNVIFKDFKKIINFLNSFSGSVTLSIYHNKLYYESENNINENVRIIKQIIDKNVVMPKDGDLHAINKYSIEYLKKFCDSFKGKDLFSLDLYLKDEGEYPLFIEYGEEYFVLAPRVNY